MRRIVLETKYKREPRLREKFQDTSGDNDSRNFEGREEAGQGRQKPGTITHKSPHSGAARFRG